jgi:hypothetical protein
MASSLQEVLALDPTKLAPRPSDSILYFFIARVKRRERKQKGHPATWAAFSSRENSSNGG